MQGVPTIRRAVINIKDKDDARGKKGDKELLVEGYGLQKVMTTQGARPFFIAISHSLSDRYHWGTYHFKSRHRDRPSIGYRGGASDDC